MTRSRIANLVKWAAVLAAIAGLSSLPAWATQAPDFTVQTIDNKTIKLKDLRGKVVLISFWTTTCPACKELVKDLEKLHKKYGKQGLVVLGVALDRAGTDTIKQFAKDRKFTYRIAVDPQAKVARKYSVWVVPTTYLVDQQGAVTLGFRGYSAEIGKRVEAEISQLLEKKQT